MDLKDAVEVIIKSFSSGDCFDSHTVIDELRNNSEYSDVYIHGIKADECIKAYHSRIACLIRDSSLVESVQDSGSDLLIKTKNVHGNLTLNHVWKLKS